MTTRPINVHSVTGKSYHADTAVSLPADSECQFVWDDTKLTTLGKVRIAFQIILVSISSYAKP